MAEAGGTATQAERSQTKTPSLQPEAGTSAAKHQQTKRQQRRTGRGGGNQNPQQQQNQNQQSSASNSNDNNNSRKIVDLSTRKNSDAEDIDEATKAARTAKRKKQRDRQKKRRQEAETERTTEAATAESGAAASFSEPNASDAIAKSDATITAPVVVAVPSNKPDNIADKKKKGNNNNKKNAKGKDKVLKEGVAPPAVVDEAETTPPKSSEATGAKSANINISATVTANDNEATDEKAAAAAARKRAKNKKRQEQRKQQKLAIKTAKVKAIASAKAAAVHAIAEEKQEGQDVDSPPPVAAATGSAAENPVSGGSSANGSTTNHKHPLPQDVQNTTDSSSNGLAPKKAKKSEILGGVAPFQEGVEGENKSSAKKKKKKNAPKKKKNLQASNSQPKSDEKSTPAVTPRKNDADDDKEWVRVTSEEAPFSDVKQCDRINEHQHQVGLMMALASVDLSIDRDTDHGQQHQRSKNKESQTGAHYALDRSYFDHLAASGSGKSIDTDSTSNGDGEALRAILFRDDSMTVGAIGMRDRVMEIYERLHLVDTMMANGRLIRISSKAKALHRERLERHAPEKEEDEEGKEESTPPVDSPSNADDIFSQLAANDAIAGTSHSNNLMATQKLPDTVTTTTGSIPLQLTSDDRDADIISSLLGNDEVKVSKQAQEKIANDRDRSADHIDCETTITDDRDADIMSALWSNDKVSVPKTGPDPTVAIEAPDRDADIMNALLGNDKVLVPKTGPVPTIQNKSASQYNDRVTVQEPAYDDAMTALWANDRAVATELGGRPSTQFDKKQQAKQEHPYHEKQSEDVSDSFSSWVDSDREVLINVSPEQPKKAESAAASNRSSSYPTDDSSNAATTKTGTTATTTIKNRNAFVPTEKEEDEKEGGCQECIGACVVS